MPNTFQLIASSTVGAGGASSIDFSSIPSTYTDLCVKLSVRISTTSIDMAMDFNGVSTNRSRITLSGDGSGVSGGSASDAFIATIDGSGQTASTFASTEIYIPNYAGSTNKSFSLDTVSENNATTAFAQLTAGLWSSTAAINQITFRGLSAFTFVQHTTAYLYGVKNA
jgi:carbon monoxide dehydrogenase subunit G